MIWCKVIDISLSFYFWLSLAYKLITTFATFRINIQIKEQLEIFATSKAIFIQIVVSVFKY